MAERYAAIYFPLLSNNGEERRENLITICDFARSLNYEIGHVYVGLDLNYVEMIVDALNGRFQAIVTMELAPIIECTDLFEALLPAFAKREIHLVTRDGLVNTEKYGRATMLNNLTGDGNLGL